MPFVVMRNSDRQVYDDRGIFATLADAQTRATALGTGYTAIATEAPDDVEPGWGVSADGTSFQKGAFLTDAQQKAAYKLLARAHAEECLDLLPAWWGRTGKDATNPRWEATYYHILGGAAIVAVAADEEGTNAFSVTEMERLFAAYRSLVPASQGDLHDWHFEATLGSGAWGDYTTAITSGDDAGKLRAYLKINKPSLTPSGGGEYTPPAFKSDAQTSTAWDGTGGTLSVAFGPNDTPRDVTA